MSTPADCCKTLREFGKHTASCEPTNQKVRAELGPPQSGQWWIGTPATKDTNQ